MYVKEWKKSFLINLTFFENLIKSPRQYHNLRCSAIAYKTQKFSYQTRKPSLNLMEIKYNKKSSKATILSIVSENNTVLTFKQKKTISKNLLTFCPKLSTMETFKMQKLCPKQPKNSSPSLTGITCQSPGPRVDKK